MGSILAIGAGVVGQAYTVTVCKLECEHAICAEPCKKYPATIKSRTDTHTFLTHANGELALPNDINISLIHLQQNEYKGITSGL